MTFCLRQHGTEVNSIPFVGDFCYYCLLDIVLLLLPCFYMVNLADFVCIGDSQLNRFCKFIKADPSLCLPGRSIREIHLYVKNLRSLPSNVIVLVGSNDLLRSGSSFPQISRDFRAFIRHLCRRCSKIIVITTPVIPFLCGESQHLEWVRGLRDLACSFVPRAAVVDLGTWDERGLTRPDYFELRYYSGRVDRLHLNRKAFTYLLSLLDRVEV